MLNAETLEDTDWFAKGWAVYKGDIRNDDQFPPLNARVGTPLPIASPATIRLAGKWPGGPAESLRHSLVAGCSGRLCNGQGSARYFLRTTFSPRSEPRYTARMRTGSLPWFMPWCHWSMASMNAVPQG